MIYKIKKHWVPILIAIILVLAIVLIIVDIRVYGTGFPGKTLWDWLQLLIVPIMLAVGGLLFNQILKNREQRAADQRAQIEHYIATDNQCEAALRNYLDRMTELVLEYRLQEKPQEDVAIATRLLTLTLLRGLDSNRKKIALQFLYESGLLTFPITLREADLSEVNLSGLNLREADLSGAKLNKTAFDHTNLNGADLQGVDLSKLDLSEVNLSGTNLSKANLSEANLSGANLSGLNLNGADLSGAQLMKTDLSRAQLMKTDLSSADLSGAKFSKANLGVSISNPAFSTLRASVVLRRHTSEVKLIERGGKLGEILQGKELSLGKGKVAPLHTLLTSLPYLQYGPTSLHVLKAGLDMLTPSMSDVLCLWSPTRSTPFLNLRFVSQDSIKCAIPATLALHRLDTTLAHKPA